MFVIIIINLKKHKKSFYNLSNRKEGIKNVKSQFPIAKNCEEFSIKINVYYILQWNRRWNKKKTK